MKGLRVKFLLFIVLLPLSIIITMNVITLVTVNSKINQVVKDKQFVVADKIGNKIHDYLMAKAETPKKVALNLSTINFLNSLSTRYKDKDGLPYDQNVHYEYFHDTINSYIKNDADFSFIFVASDKTSLYYEHDQYEKNDNGKYDVHEKDWYNSTIENDGLSFSEPYVPDSGDIPVVTISYPIKSKRGKLLGASGTDLSIGFVQDYVKNYHVGDHGFVFLTSKNGNIVSHPNETYVDKQTSIGDINDQYKSLSEKMETNDSGIHKMSIDNRDKMIFYKEIEDIGWSIGVVIDVKESIDSYKRIIYLISVLLIVGSLVTFIVISFIMERLITKDMERLTIFTNHLSEGDFTHNCKIHRNDEIGQLSTSINHLVDKVSEVISSVRNSSESFEIATKEIALGNQDLSHKASGQSATLEEISSSLGEIVESVESAVGKTQNTMNLIEGVKDHLNELAESGKKMENVIKVINDIAFETNLLALNASIEAARAGDHGKGFEVVATEVKELSEHSSTQAKEITQMIKNNVGMIHESTVMIDDVVNIVSDIASVRKEQSESISQINSGIEDLNLVIQDNTALIEQSSATSEEIATQAHELNEKVKFFKVHGDVYGDAKEILPMIGG